jgi:glycerol-3-phosphate acyltransferase PlsX
VVKKEIILSIDAMGSDRGPQVIIEGVVEAKSRYPHVKYLLHGNKEILQPLLDENKKINSSCEIIHANDQVGYDQTLSQSVRRGKNTSMWMAIESIKNGQAHGSVSAGNTGVLMAMSKLNLRMLPNIERPAICSLFPNKNGETVMLDLGANATCNVRNLVEFTIMGMCFSKIISGINNPLVGLLNVGSEEIKGTDTLKEAASIIKRSDIDINFYGFIEGDDIALGTVDVVVTDGFTGNIALKSAEGTAKLYTSFLKSAFKSSLIAKLGYLLVKPSLSKVIIKTDPRRYNGALLVGLNGIVVKSHGGTDSFGFANAIGVAVDLVDRDLNQKIAKDLEGLYHNKSNELYSNDIK